jgi:serine/threonine protein kinase/Flp pilus assembly protein TadD
MSPRPAAGIASSLDPVLGRLIDVLTARLQAGEAVDAEAVAREHPEYAAELRGLLPALAALGELSRSAADPPAGAEDGLVPGVLGDFRIRREVGRGGMGVVYEAEQVSLGRRVALKVLPFAATLDARQLQRFHNEARAAAGLHHEHIVPVYGVGCERGVHYYAMQLIDGRSLAEVIRDLRGADGSPPAAGAGAPEGLRPGGDSPTPPVAALTTERGRSRGHEFFRATAQLVAQAAEALEHAHATGIVHRDIKPANLLLGASGKLWVADFGLARFDPDAGLTLTGDFLGTLRYMSPEQALAKHGLVDHRTDVYSLGATLYELLTLTPAVDGADKQEILQKIAFEEPTPPRKLDKAIPADLETIALKCLAKSPAERYATAGELADDLRRWLDHKPVQARRPSFGNRLGKWVRRNRPVVATAACLLAVLAVTLASATAVSIWYAIDAGRARQIADHQRQSAEANFRLARQAVKDAVTKLAGEPKLKEADFHDLRRRLLESAVPFYEEFVKQRSDDPKLEAERGEAYAWLADLRRELGDREAARGNYEQAREIFSRLAETHPHDPEYRHWLADCRHDLGRTLTDLGRLPAAEAEYRAAAQLYAALADELPGAPGYRMSMGMCHNSLGTLFAGQGRWAEAEAEFRAAVQSQKALADAFPHVPNFREMLAGGRLNLGNVHKFRGRLAEAEAEYRAAAQLYAALAGEFPHEPRHRKTLADSHNNLGNVLNDLGQLAEAETEYRAALTLRVALADEFPRVPEYRITLARSRGNLGTLLRDLSRPTQAEAEFRHALAAFTQLSDAFPLVPEYRWNLATCHNGLGMVVANLGKWAEAEAEYRAALTLLAPLVGEFPHVPEYRKDLAESRHRLGGVLGGLHKHAEAEAEYRAALALQKALADEIPGVPAYRTALAETHNELGLMLMGLGRPSEAEEEYRRALTTYDGLRPGFSTRPRDAVGLGGVYCNLGNLARRGGRPADSLAWYGQAIGTLEAVLPKAPRSVEAHRFLRNAHEGRAGALMRLGRFAEALADWDRAVELDEAPQRPPDLLMRAVCLARLDPTRAVAEVEQLVQREKPTAAMLYDVACVYSLAASGEKDSRRERYAARAVEVLRQAQAGGFFGEPDRVAHLKKDPDLDPIRGREDFRLFLQALDKNTK